MKGSWLLFNLKLNCLIFFYQSKQLTNYIYTDVYCKLSKCIGQTPCSYEHYHVNAKQTTGTLVVQKFYQANSQQVKIYGVRP